MRGMRWLLLVAIAAIVGGVSITYQTQKKDLAKEAPPKPPSLPRDVQNLSKNYSYERNEKGRPCPRYGVTATEYRMAQDASRVDMSNVSLKLYNSKCTTYNLVKTASAQFFPNDNRFFSEGEVEMTLDVPLNGAPKHQLVSIKTSGVTLDTTVGSASTEKPTKFTFLNGDGSATGATYNPQSRELELKSDVVLHRHPPDSKPMTVEAGHLLYKAATGEVFLSPWGRLTRDNLIVEGENPVIKLRNKEYLQNIHAVNGHGTEETVKPAADGKTQTRKLLFAANDLYVDFDDHGEVEKISGEQNARLDETTDSALTNVAANHVEMNFQVVTEAAKKKNDAPKKESILNRVAATGNGVVNSRPVAVPGKTLSESHVLKSDSLEMRMRPDGQEIESVATHAPGTLEFLPNAPDQRRRVLTGNNMLIAYGPKNQIESFKASDSKTETDPLEAEKKRGRSVSYTASREIQARFKPGGSTLSALDQSGAFAYDEGERHARADHATLDQEQNVMNLEKGARIWDSSGATNADHIRMDQRSGDFVADGNVTSSRMPEADPKRNSQMLSGDQPMQASAGHMESTNRNQTIRYRGNAQMWQGANRIMADSIDLDRDKDNKTKRGLTARGNVVTNFWETPKATPAPVPGSPVAAKPVAAAASTTPAAPVQTVVRAGNLVYTDENRLAVYTGGVTLVRPNLREKSKELRTYLAENGADSRLEKAFADGAVEIIQTASDHTRVGTAEHCEYLVSDDKVILRGGAPRYEDSANGKRLGYTTGGELTYFISDGALQNDAAPGQVTESRIIRNKKKK